MDTSFEPMDVDRSASSASKMDISFNDTVHDDDKGCKSVSREGSRDFPEVLDDDIFISSNNITIKKEELVDSQQEIGKSLDNTTLKPQISSIKTYHIKMHHLRKKEPPSKFKYFLICGFMLFLSLVTFHVINFKCSEEIDLHNLRKSLNENIFGQLTAVHKVIEILNMQDRSKIIFLFGGSGVGKTYMLSFIMDKLWDATNVYHYTMPTFVDTFSPELMPGLFVCKTSMLVVDDLTRNDMHITSHIKNVIMKSEKLGKNMTIILVYNCDNVTDNFVKKCDDSFQSELEKTFENIDAEKYFIKFEPLALEHLKRCIKKELGYRVVSEQEMDSILKNFDVSLDGCKGVYKKMKFMNVF